MKSSNKSIVIHVKLQCIFISGTSIDSQEHFFKFYEKYILVWERSKNVLTLSLELFPICKKAALFNSKCTMITSLDCENHSYYENLVPFHFYSIFVYYCGVFGQKLIGKFLQNLSVEDNCSFLFSLCFLEIPKSFKLLRIKSLSQERRIGKN